MLPVLSREAFRASAGRAAGSHIFAHADRSTNAREGIDHEADERPKQYSSQAWRRARRECHGATRRAARLLTMLLWHAAHCLPSKTEEMPMDMNMLLFELALLVIVAIVLLGIFRRG